MINEKEALRKLRIERERKLRENKELLNYGRKAEYRNNCLYISGLSRAEDILKDMGVLP